MFKQTEHQKAKPQNTEVTVTGRHKYTRFTADHLERLRLSGFRKTSCSRNVCNHVPDCTASQAQISQPTHSNVPCYMSVCEQNIASQYEAQRQLSRYVQHSAYTAQHTTHNIRDPAGQAVNLWGGNRVQQHFCRTAELVASPTDGLFVFRTRQFAASRTNRRTNSDAARKHCRASAVSPATCCTHNFPL
jgi:hypothetical protein